MNLPLSILLLFLLALLALVSYVDRLYHEMGKFLSREFQENIDAYEQLVEPRLGFTPGAGIALDGSAGADLHGLHRSADRLPAVHGTRAGLRSTWCRPRSASSSSS